MRGHADDEIHGKETTHALNVLYVYDRTYEPYLVYWLFPLQITFADNKGRSELTSYYVACSMHLPLAFIFGHFHFFIFL